MKLAKIVSNIQVVLCHSERSEESFEKIFRYAQDDGASQTPMLQTMRGLIVPLVRSSI